MQLSRQQSIQQFFENISAMKRGIYGQLHTIEKQCPVPRAQLELLGVIRQLQPVSSKRLASHMYLTAGAVSQLTESLETLKYIQRSSDPLDRRTQLLVVAKKGSKLLQDMEKRRRKLLEELLRELTDDELHAWLHMQQKVISHIQSNTPH